MRSQNDVSTPDETSVHLRKVICVICGRLTRGRWAKVKGQRLRIPMRHKINAKEYCVGSYRAAIISKGSRAGLDQDLDHGSTTLPEDGSKVGSSANAICKKLDRIAEKYGVQPRSLNETNADYRAKVLAAMTPPSKGTLSEYLSTAERLYQLLIETDDA